TRAIMPFAVIGPPHGACSGAHQDALQRRRHRLRAERPSGLDVHPFLPVLPFCDATNHLPPLAASRASRLTEARRTVHLARGGVECDRVMTSAERDATKKR